VGKCCSYLTFSLSADSLLSPQRCSRRRLPLRPSPASSGAAACWRRYTPISFTSSSPPPYHPAYYARRRDNPSRHARARRRGSRAPAPPATPLRLHHLLLNLRCSVCSSNPTSPGPGPPRRLCFPPGSCSPSLRVPTWFGFSSSTVWWW
jgi:hypothetical protein